MEDRRTELDLTWDEVAERSDRSKETLFQVAKGRIPQARTRTAIDRGLYWKRGSVDSILAGGEPTKVDHREQQSEPEDQADIHAELAELRKMAEQLKARAEEDKAHADQSAEFVRSVLDRVERLLQTDEKRAAQ